MPYLVKGFLEISEDIADAQGIFHTGFCNGMLTPDSSGPKMKPQTLDESNYFNDLMMIR